MRSNIDAEDLQEPSDIKRTPPNPAPGEEQRLKEDGCSERPMRIWVT